MQPTDILRNEHRVIEQVLCCLERIANQFDSEGILDKDAARQAIDFFQNFADRCHHGKEEAYLFPFLQHKDFRRLSQPVGRMLMEHDEVRDHIRAMVAALDEAEPDARGAVTRFAAHARAYIVLLREHIQKEDHCLFPVAEEILSELDKQVLNRSFHQVEHDDMGTGTHEKYLKLANDLADHLGVERSVVEHAVGQGCGCHSN